jgi:glycosyltransferase involved in cell wall biosynthesis
MSDISKPVFSIITPTFRRPILLKRTITSVINQTFRDYEHIIIDDANDPETESIVKGFCDNRIIFHQHIKPKGAACVYNAGIELSIGKFIITLDDDDEFLPAFLEKIYNQFTFSSPNVGFIWTGISRIRDTGSGEILLNSKVWPQRFPTKLTGMAEATSIGNNFGVCVRKSCFDIIGLYDESIPMGHDTDLLFRLAYTFDFETIPDILVKIHFHGSSQLTNEKNNLVRLELLEKTLLKHQAILKEFPLLYYVHYKVVVNLCYKLKLKKKGRKTMLSIIKNSPFRILNFSDLLFYELFGSDTISSLYESWLRKLVHFFKGKS